MIRHIVMWKFKEGADPSEFLSRLEGLYGTIECIRALSVRRSAVENAEFDAVLTSDFDTLEDVERYKTDPRHMEVAALCKQICVSRCAIDVEV